MVRRIILHIGPAKTGTSSLQEALYAARAGLQAQGVAYPEFGRHRLMPRLPGHHGIAAELRRGAGLPADVAEGLAALGQDEAVILSSEDFSLMDEAAAAALVAQLRELAGEARIEVVYYARRWDGLLPSVWQELVKHGHRWPYLEFLGAQVSAPRASHYLNYAVPLGRWAKAAGKENLRIFSYDSAVAEAGDIVSHFCTEVLDCTPPQAPARRDNPRWPPERLEILRVLNRLAFGRGKGDASLRTLLVGCAADLAEDLAALEEMLQPHVVRCRPCAPLVLANLERPFLTEFGTQAENLNADGRLFAGGPFAEAAYVHPDYLIATGALPRLKALHRKLQAPAES